MSTIPLESLVAVLDRAHRPDRLGKLIHDALVLIETVLASLGEEAVGMSFNGGKDCTVLLHLYAAMLYARYAVVDPQIRPRADESIRIPPMPASPSSTAPHSSDNTDTQPPPLAEPINTPMSINDPPHPHPEGTSASASTAAHRGQHFTLPPPTSLPYPPIRSIYITAPNPFAELDRFVLSSTERYGLDLYRFGGGMKAALEAYLACGGGKGVRGILVGTRRGDPNGVDVPELAPTDPTWPPLLRIHPILHWTYADIWDFLRQLSVPYCSLYDEGYTSLGSTTNTSPNPLLKTAKGWDPAWKLQDESQERAGRHR